MSQRDFSTISPSAKMILLLKGYTTIPYAKKTAELISEPEKFMPDFNNPDLSFWGRVFHFEIRYLSIDHLLEDLTITNIMELSSGFSFRGLDKTTKSNVYYIDTDLPDLIATKKAIADKLKEEHSQKGTLELLPLNVLDESQFRQIVSHFPDGEIVIVNEGLLMYLNKEEKEKLCRIIHSILKERGGYWITADIYIKTDLQRPIQPQQNELSEFLEQHKIEDNKFESFETAKLFFKQNGFEIDREAEVDISKLNSINYLKKSLEANNIDLSDKQPVKMQATWRLRLSE